jgi:hypothetical protein
MGTLKDVQSLASKATVKEERARDAVRAMQEYEAERLAVLAKTARLRALRLARDAGSVPQKQTRRKAKENG